MKNLLIVFVVALLAACSSSKQVAKFPSSRVDVGYHVTKITNTQPEAAAMEEPSTLTASTSAQPVLVPTEEVKNQVKEAYKKLSKQEKKEVRQLLKKEIKTITKNNKKTPNPDAVTARGGIDHDLKLAAIFGAVGLVGLLIGGNVFTVIGAIALIIGVVFFVKWLIRQ